jgi:ribonuclease Z
VPIPTDIVPLGTASALPVRGRHLTSFALRREGQVLLFDCGEGTQFQLLEAGLKRSKVEAVFITHFHGDHLYGLPGLMMTLNMLERTEPLTLVGPAGLREIVTAMPGLSGEWLSYDVRYVELDRLFKHEIVYDQPEFFVEARPLEHRVFCAGYRFVEKTRPGKVDGKKARELGVAEGWQFEALKEGKAVRLADGHVVQPDEVVGPRRPGVRVAFVYDTMPCAGGRALAQDADLLVHEATFCEEQAERAETVGHSTGKQAAEVAQAAGAKRLLLTHFSARFPDPQPIVDEARAVFPNAEAAKELETYRVEPDA